MKTFFATLLSATLLTGAATAEETFCDFTGNAIDFKKLGAEINGTWFMTGVGQRIATGVTKHSFNVSTNATNTQMFISGGGGPKLQLKPIARAKYAQVPVSKADMRAKKLNYLTQDGKQLNTSVEEVGLVAGCALEDAPVVYWYKDFGGGRTAYGVYMFISDQFGVGLIKNNANAARTVFLTR